jgi:MFS family permease
MEFPATIEANLKPFHRSYHGHGEPSHLVPSTAAVISRTSPASKNFRDSTDRQAAGISENGAGVRLDSPRSSEFPRPVDRRWITAALMLVMVLAAMELTVTSTAMPTIIGQLHGLEHYSWVTSVYLLICTVTMPIYGRLADVVGRKRVVLAAIGLFCIASMLAASAQNLGQLILFRGLQGLGAGGIMPVVLTILGDIFTLEERAKIQGLFSAVWGGSSLAGPAIGALLVRTLGWRSIFFVNLPLGALGFFVLVQRYHDHEKPHSTDLDIPGAALLTTTCSAILGLVFALGVNELPWYVAAGLAILGLAAAVALVHVERRASNPILPLDLLAQRAIGPALLSSALMGVAFFGVDTYVPLYVQGTTGAGPEAAAGVVTPVMFAWAISGIVVAPIIVRFGFRYTAVTGSLITSLSFTGLFVCALLKAHGVVLAAVLMASGLGFGAASMSYLLSAQESVSWQQRGIITSGVQFVRTMGGAIGIGLLGMLFNVLSAPQMQQLRDMGVAPATVMDPLRRDQLPAAAHSIIVTMIDSGLTWVFAAMAATAVVQTAISFLMAPSHECPTAEETEAIEALPV